ncbi:MFS transporter [Serratia entomophila]|uniref:MFS transporter n=1 Tax=Serratia entomophila TaxID=42906 RepID=UPI0021779C1F|nr:MFS transporter [Serratia entomophila]CAI0775930.1 Purine efflux pump PbuE [Serratia entomophila]CAI0804882.1 Purine efflux pump PbuE [Serratia entomophila]CAI1556491.1 Purine efflux pump PbuE [Serratia entomophila]CAI1589262.1 Purine efflux pump PbuE [Serratia entomophila]CAI1604947.1 Purine efflux pump PbuE [Serratia entomophila]
MTLLPPIFFIALGLFGVYCIEFGVVGILPMIIERYGISTAQAGWLVGVFALTIALLGPLLVLLASRINRKRMLLISLCVFAVAGMWSAQVDSFAALMLLRIAPALFHPIYFSLAMVAAASLYPPEQVTRATAYAFIGTSMGMVLGIPLTHWIAAQISYAASFRFSALINLLAAAGLMLRLPNVAARRLSYGKQLAILRSGALWLNISACVLIFAAMFAVYAYAAEYLSRETAVSDAAIGLLLVIFGLGGVAGNLLAGRLLQRNRAVATLLHPLALAAAYLLLYRYAGAGMGAMIAICLYWGAAHTSGLIVTQIWLTSEAPQAPEFVTGLYIAFINLGVALGSAVSGWFIDAIGLQGSLLCGALFAALAVMAITARLRLYRKVTAALSRSSP